MRILVTGGAGFIGSHLCEELVSERHCVFCLDNFNDYYNPEIKRKNISSLLKSSKSQKREGKFYLIEGDIRDRVFLSNLFKENHFNMIIHLAAMAGVRLSIKKPTLYYDVNLFGTLNLLDCAKEFGVKNFIFASSSSIYGNNKKVPFCESDPVDNPISPYAASKKAGELICHTYHHLYGISVTCLRFFTVYGARQRPDLAIHKFAALIDNNETIPVYGDGKQKRDFTFISDIIEGIKLSIDFNFRNHSYEIFNLGESETVSVQEMISELAQVLDKDAVIKYYPKESGDVDITYASLEKSRRMLNYNPKIPFKVGLAIFVEWFKHKKLEK